MRCQLIWVLMFNIKTVTLITVRSQFGWAVLEKSASSNTRGQANGTFWTSTVCTGTALVSLNDLNDSKCFFIRKHWCQECFPAEAVTLHLSSMPSGYLSPASDRIRQVSVTTFDACAHMQAVFETLFPHRHLLERLNSMKCHRHH